ncbi:MetQ/NlpA family ABC transporter substrate-binding protein [Quadrisphaera sp. DSM 44207]|uniref:MetQ/NlpA family ABC transporter substrate-binding protein n=1 Tax=Quadrisphaera sp. DSM 44207 TaxID=1881057 RepID=UPI0008817335|nr:MetQ/NlpA family ABC transporter substrate-binding protein [Quadrisphaera sp. DSM 44207]SDQ32807.1 ABC-type metal ion transport system, substrate-binding protein/surface antigen [Quadrisphaera sp. DSM 44207]
MTTEPTTRPAAPVDETHGFTLRRARRWPWVAGAGLAAAGVAAAVVVPRLTADPVANEVPGATLYVATAEGNAREQALVEFVAEEVAPRYGIEVAFKGLADSNTINRAVSEGEVAATVYQHELWLSQVLEANPDFEETAATPVFRWGFGLWSDRWGSVEEIPDGATISLYSDPANEAQGLWVLERADLITLDPAVDEWRATVDDVAENPKGLQFTLLDFGAQSRALPDLDAAVGYTEYYLAAKVPLEKQIFAPPAPDEFAGQLTVGTEWLDEPNIVDLVEAFQDPAVQEYLATDPEVQGVLLPLDAR